MRELLYLTLTLTTLLVVCATNDFMTLESFLQPLKDESDAAQLLNAATTANEKPTSTQDNNEGGTIITTTTTSEYSSLRPPKQEIALPPTSNKDEAPPHVVGNMDPVPDQHMQRIVTYDQRQEGQYNVRADLENFMIVLVPPNPAQGLNLLDLLAKSKFRRGSTLAMKERHKLYPTLTETSDRGTIENVGYTKTHAKKPLTKYSPKLEQVGPGNHGKPEFIEGRTPYHVDISANDEAQSRLQPDRQVDVLPPPYYPQLPFKPVHLEAEPTVIQALPPTDLGRYNLLEVANAGYNNNQQALQNSRGFYRDSRAIRADNLLDSNRLPAGAGLQPNVRAVNVPLYRAEVGNVNGHGLYPPIDAPDFQTVDSTRAWRLVDVESAPRHLVKNVDLEFDLIGDDFDDLKLLLGDGLERCAPGHRRDSYGVCREIEGY